MRRIQLFKLESQVVEFVLRVRLFFPKRDQLAVDFFPLREALAVGVHLIGLLREVVHEAKLEGGIIQQQRVMLTVHVDKPFAQLA